MVIKNPAVRLAMWALGVWLLLVAMLAAWFFLVPHGPGFAPEIGPLGSFLYFLVYYSIPYFVTTAGLVLLVTAFWFFYFRKPKRRQS